MNKGHFALRIALFYHNGQVDFIYVALADIEALSPILGHRAIELSLEWRKGVTQEEFVGHAHELFDALGVAGGRVIGVDTASSDKHVKHANFMRALFPDTARDFIDYHYPYDIKAEMQEYLKERHG